MSVCERVCGHEWGGERKNDREPASVRGRDLHTQRERERMRERERERETICCMKVVKNYFLSSSFCRIKGCKIKKKDVK